VGDGRICTRALRKADLKDSSGKKRRLSISKRGADLQDYFSYKGGERSTRRGRVSLGAHKERRILIEEADD